jgi:hypothetical protein
MENKASQNIQIGTIGGVTITISNILATNLHSVDSDVWRNSLIVSISIFIMGVVLGTITSKLQDGNRISWKISVFFMSLGMSWVIIALLKLI